MRRIIEKFQSNNVIFQINSATLLREIKKLRAKLTINQHFVFYLINKLHKRI